MNILLLQKFANIYPLWVGTSLIFRLTDMGKWIQKMYQMLFKRIQYLLPSCMPITRWVPCSRLKEIAGIASQSGIAFHSDAAQSVGKVNTDVNKLGVDLLTIAGHKLYAPKGIGALYIRHGTRIDNLLYGAGQENGLRPGTENVIHIVALGKACEIAKRDFDKNVQTMVTTRDRLLGGLKSKLGERIKVNVDLSGSLPNTLSVSFDKTEAHALASLIGKEVYISTGSACHADSIEISPVLQAMKLDLLTAASTVRISTGKFTSEEEIDQAVETITNAVQSLS